MATASATTPKLPTFPKYGTSTSTGDLAAADRAAIAYLFDPSPNFNEVDSLAAERALRSGTVGSGFAANNQLRLRDSERINRAQIGHQMLDPYLQREQQVALQTNDNAARLQQIAAQGEEARRQLELQQSGQMALQSADARARLEQIAAQGAQAMEQLKLSEAGDTNRTNLNNAADLERTILGGAFSLYGRTAGGGGSGVGGVGSKGGWNAASANPANIGSSTKPFGMGTPQGFPGPSGPTLTAPGSNTPVNSPNVNTPQAGSGQSTGAAATRIVDQILSRYGLN